MFECPPVIGVLVADGSVVEIGYMPILSNPTPDLRQLLDLVQKILTWADVETSAVVTSSWEHSDCTPRAASGPHSPNGRMPFRGGTTHE